MSDPKNKKNINSIDVIFYEDKTISDFEKVVKPHNTDIFLDLILISLPTSNLDDDYIHEEDDKMHEENEEVELSIPNQGEQLRIDESQEPQLRWSEKVQKIFNQISYY